MYVCETKQKTKHSPESARVSNSVRACKHSNKNKKKHTFFVTFLNSIPNFKTYAEKLLPFLEQQ